MPWAATIAQSVISNLRTRLFAHLQRLPLSHLDRMPVGDAISRCTSDVETLDVVFSSGIAVLVANLARLLTLPLFPGMTDADTDDVVRAVAKVLGRYLR